MPYATPFERYVAPARARPALWRLGLGVLLALAIYVGLVVALFAAAAPLFDALDRDGLVDQLLGTPRGVLVVLGSFAGLALGTMAATRWLHRRRVGSLFGRGAQVVRDFLAAAGLFWALALPATGVTLLFIDVEPGLPLAAWLALLPLTVLGLLVQTLAEELFFRAYLLQALAARFGHALAWMVLPSLVFGSLHYNGAMAPGAGFAAVGAITLFGLVAADLTRLTGSIGAAWGFHFANNFVALALVAVDDTITGLAFKRTALSAQDPGLHPALFLIDAALIVGAWLLCRRVLRR